MAGSEGSGSVQCGRCGHVAPSPINLWVHRHRFDLFSECDRRLVRSFFNRIRRSRWADSDRDDAPSIGGGGN